jgi:large subunit ribosomal protein L29
MKIAELRSKSAEELKDLIVSLKKEQFNLRFQKAAGSTEGAARVTLLRKTVARVKTLQNETPEMAAKIKAKPATEKKAAPAKKTAKAKKEKE